MQAPEFSPFRISGRGVGEARDDVLILGTIKGIRS